MQFGCGQCIPCRVSRRRQWTWRQYFESLCHQENCFVTLTYDDGNLPAGGNLQPDHVQLWLKRFRKALSPTRIRFFLVGEYGDLSLRPHYHLSVFGVSGDTILDGGQGADTVAGIIARTWAKGIVHVAEFNETTAQYVCGYVVKKMTSADDPRLKGRHPEFARMSRRPGLAADAMKVVAKSLLAQKGPLPDHLLVGKRKVLLGRYVLQKLREAVGLSPDQISELKSLVSYENSLEMSAVLTDRLRDAPLSPVTSTTLYYEQTSQKVIQIETRSRIYRKVGVI